MIQVITIEEGIGIVDREETDILTLPLIDGVIHDRIYIRPDWPPLGDPRFAARLRAWHIEHNFRVRGEG